MAHIIVQISYTMSVYDCMDRSHPLQSTSATALLFGRSIPSYVKKALVNHQTVQH